VNLAATVAKHKNHHGVHETVIEHAKVEPTGQPSENVVASTK
jgi:hypothetical protein